MSKKFSKKPLALAMGAAFALGTGAAQASVFALSDLGTGYMVAQATPATPADPKLNKDGTPTDKAKEGKCGEGKCGGDKKADGKCGEGKCGGDKGKHKGHDKKADGKCGEGKCGSDKKGEGKCGEGKCGGKK